MSAQGFLRELVQGLELKTSDLVISTADGHRLAATLYEPDAANGIVVQINSSSWTPRRYYRSFSDWLTVRGFTVLTWDYRGIGDSATANEDEQNVRDWGAKDMPAITAWLKERFPGKRLVLVAHSLGGQIVGLSPNVGEFRAMLLVATAHGWWRLWPQWRRRLRMFLGYFVLLPPIIAITGRGPSWAFIGTPIPKTIAKQMVRFGRHRRWLVDDENRPLRPHNAEIRCPVRHIVIEDDEVVPPGSDIDMADFFPNAERRRDVYAPAHWGVEQVKHFGFFRRSMPEAAWEDVAAWLRGKTAA